MRIWHRQSELPRRRGVTLVEMLIVVALTVLLMSIVAEVFVLASETLSQLRILSNMNQKIRQVETTLRRDLQHRTIREVAPPVERMAGPDGVFGTEDDYIVPVGIDPKDNLGYFSYEENSPADEQGEDGDDVLAWTVKVPVSAGSGYIGRVVLNSQPDLADGVSDGLATSAEAEIIYFLHEGSLYRRVLLVGMQQPEDTGLVTANPRLLPNPQSWYAAYDISARPPLVAFDIPIVNTLGDLTHRSARYGNVVPAGYTAVPNRGLEADNPDDPSWPFLALLSYEDDNANNLHDAMTASDFLDHNRNYPYQLGTNPLSDPEHFFGRTSLRETSSPAWDYPENPASTVWGNYFLTGTPQSHEDLFSTGVRPCDDVVLTNVLSFDVKAWDPDGTALPPLARGIQPPHGAYVDLGKLAPDGALNQLPGNIIPGPFPSIGTAAGLPGCNPFAVIPAIQAFCSFYPQPGVWPPKRPPRNGNDGVFGTADDRPWLRENVGTVSMGGYRRGMGTPFGMISYTTGTPTLNGSGFAIPIGAPGLPTGMLMAPNALWRSYDTWCSDYTKREGQVNPITSLPSTPVAPPYMTPLRGIQIKIRFVDADSGRTREITLVQELH